MIKTKISVIVVSVCAIFSLLYPFGNGGAAGEERDYTLEELISIAIEKNPSIAIFEANLEASKGEIISARAYPNPALGIQAGRGRAFDTEDSDGEYSIAITQPLEWHKKRFYRRKAAEADAAAVEKEMDDFRLELKSEVKKAFYWLLLSNKTVDIANEILRIAGGLLKAVDVRVRAGEAPEFELVKAKVEMLKAEKELGRAKNVVTVSMTSLNALLGGALNNDFDIEGAFILPEKRYNLETLISRAMEDHPLILKAKNEAVAKGHSLEMEKASILPGVTIEGFFNREIDKEAYGIGLSIPTPIWYRRKGEIATASAEKRKAEAEVNRVKIELSRAVTEEYRNYLIALDQIEVFEKGLLMQAEEALKIADLAYKEGESGILDYLDAQRVYSSTLTEYYRVFFELETSLASLEKVSGGVP